MYTLEFKAKVVGFNITDELLTLHNDDVEKPLLNVYLMKGSERDMANDRDIFNMSTYGLNFAKENITGTWVKIR